MNGKDECREEGRRAFLAALAENEDDDQLRLVYADWLEDQGEIEEAERQRCWRAAKDWLEVFAADNSHRFEQVTYDDLIEIGQEAVADADAEAADAEGQEPWYSASCGNRESLCARFRNDPEARHNFWRNWSTVTGIDVPEDIEERSSFSCAC
jgi:uncharacterized protein (TIGR02996 family)